MNVGIEKCEIDDFIVTDDRFISASADGTLKVWNVARVGITRKYIAQFDRSDTPTAMMVAGAETALTVGTGAAARYVTTLCF